MSQIDWGQAQQFRLALGLVRSPLAVYTTGKARHFGAQNGRLPESQVERFCEYAKDWSVGTVVDRPLPLPPDWHQRTDPDAFYSNGTTRRVWGARAGDVASCTALRLEADGVGEAADLFAVLAQQFARPTVQVLTGNRGAHFYWRLWTPISKDQHRDLQLRLHQLANDHLPAAGWDKNIYSHARVMRLPGSWHPKTGKQVTYSEHGCFFGVEELADRLPQLRQHTPPPSPVPTPHRRPGGRGWLGDLWERDRKLSRK